MDFLFFLINILCDVLTLLIVARIVISWITPGQTNAVSDFLYHVTEPMLSPLRRIIPRYGPIDFAPAVAVIILRLIIFLVP